MPEPAWLIIGGIALMVGIACFFVSKHSRRLLEEMWAVDTYRAKDLRRMVSGKFDATVEVEGTVSCDQPVRSLAAKVLCCYYETTVYREERRTRIVTESGPGGRKRTRTQVDYHWVPETTGKESAVFKVHDETGFTLVDPRKAKIDTKTVFETTQHNREDWFGSLVGISDTGKYRIEEKAFLPEGYVFVLGRATYSEKDKAALIRYPEKGYMDPKKKFFLISRKSEKELTKSRQKRVRILTWICAVGFLTAVACLIAYTGFF